MFGLGGHIGWEGLLAKVPPNAALRPMQIPAVEGRVPSSPCMCDLPPCWRRLAQGLSLSAFCRCTS